MHQGSRSRVATGALIAVAIVAVSLHAQQRQVAKPQIRKVPAPLPSVVTHTDLRVCVHAAGCPPSVPGLVADLPLDLSQSLNREFTWTTDAKNASRGRWQIARRPFPAAAAARPEGLIAEGDAGPGSGGKFWLDLRKPSAAPSTPVSGQMASMPRVQPTRPAIASNVGGTYYVRVVTLAGTAVIGSPSNTVTLRVNAGSKPAPPPSNPLVTYPTDVYSVAIASFEPIRPATLPWGCLEVVSVDPTVAGLPLCQVERNTVEQGCGNVELAHRHGARGPLFAPVNGPLPLLRPGQSVQIPFWLTVVPYWLPGHQDLIKQAGGFVQYNDWPHLYYGATVTGSAAILCPSTTTLEPAPCSAPATVRIVIPGAIP